MDEFLFVNKTIYDTRALIALNDLAEKSVRKEKSRRTRLISLILGLAGLVGGAFVYPRQSMVGTLLLLYGCLLLLLTLSWKSFQLRSTQRQLQSGMKNCLYQFGEEEFVCETESGETRYLYDQVFAVVENESWYVLFFDAGHGVILDKNGFTEGDAMSFKMFIGQHTQLPIQTF